MLVGVGLLCPAAWADTSDVVEGVITLMWGDGPATDPVAKGPIVMLTDAAGRRFELLLQPGIAEPLGGVRGLNRRRVVVHGSRTFAPGRPADAAMRVDRLEMERTGSPVASEAVAGSQPWVSLLCKFADVPLEPRPLAYFQDMYGSAAPRLGDYWREASYGRIDLQGSTARGWYTLPQPRSYYVSSDGYASLTQLFNDCTAVADHDVHFPDYVGINLMFNDLLDCCAWGGTEFTTLDGVTGYWRVSYEPPWGFENVSVMAHEMGHGFGLYHSGFLGDYDSSWDVMSNTWLCNPPDATFGCTPQHTIALNKLWLGWYRPPESLFLQRDDSTTIWLDRLARPEWPTTKLLFVPNTGGTGPESYTVESRKRVGNYDGQLPGDAVIVHRVYGVAKVVGSDGAAGAMLTPGEVFRDETNDIGVAVLSSTPEGALVAVGNGSSLAASFPSVDAASAQGTSSNLNGVFEPGETIQFGAAWTNVTNAGVTATGTASDFWGLEGASYTIQDDQAAFGTVLPVTTSACQAQGNCYLLRVTEDGDRPLTHWHAQLTETLSTGATKRWSLHLGGSFSDVPTPHWAYSAVESLLHSGITAGCGPRVYCPDSPVTRRQMAVFLARGLMGLDLAVPSTGTVPGLGPYDCSSGGASLFADVSPVDPACAHVHFIASQGITSGCGDGNFCPETTLSRWQMAVFLARAMAGTALPASGFVPGKGHYNCVSGGTSVFVDVPPAGAGCNEVHFLAAKQVTVGCGNGNFCPATTLSRDQMAVFLTRAFRLAIYRP
jgi:hypothetical protein